MRQMTGLDFPETEGCGKIEMEAAGFVKRPGAGDRWCNVLGFVPAGI